MKKAKNGYITKPGGSEPDILKWLKVKQNRMRFFRQVWERWDWDIAQRNYGRGMSMGVGRDDPQKLLNFHKIYHALYATYGHDIPNIDYISELYFILYKLYWKRIEKYAIKKVKANGGYWPMLGYTDTVKELLRRGWVHEAEANLDKDEVKLVCLIAPLVWPDTFEQHTHAMGQLKRIGIPGRTGTKIPNQK